MTRTNDLQAAYDAADQRVHEARQALNVAINDRRLVAQAIEDARTPADLAGHLERLATAQELTADEQAERDAAQAAYEDAVAKGEPASASGQPPPADKARRALNAVIRRTDAARMARRSAVREEWSASHREKPQPRGIYDPKRMTFGIEPVQDGFRVRGGRKVKDAA